MFNIQSSRDPGSPLGPDNTTGTESASASKFDSGFDSDNVSFKSFSEYEDNKNNNNNNNEQYLPEYESLNTKYDKEYADLPNAIDDLDKSRNSLLFLTKNGDKIIYINPSKHANGFYNVYDFTNDKWLFDKNHCSNIFAICALPGGQSLFK